MRLVDIIYQELWSQLESGQATPQFYEQMLAKYSRSKGSFYLALDRVLVNAKPLMAQLSSQISGLRSQLDSLNQQLSQARSQLAEYQDRIQRAESKLAQLNSEIQDQAKLIQSNSALLDGIRKLSSLGWDAAKLELLASRIQQICASHGIPRDVALHEFFSLVERYGDLLGLDQERQKLRSQIQGATAQLQQLSSKLNQLNQEYAEFLDAIKSLRALRSRKVTDSDLIAWGSILAKLNLDPAGFSQLLRKYQDLESLIQDQQSKLAQLESQIKHNQQLLDQLKQLESLGFDAQKLARIRQCLDLIRSHGGEIEPRFFELIGSYESLISIESKISQLESQSAQLQAQIAKLESQKQQLELQNEICWNPSGSSSSSGGSR